MSLRKYAVALLLSPTASAALILVAQGWLAHGENSPGDFSVYELSGPPPRRRLSAFGCFNGLSSVHWHCRNDGGSTETVEIGREPLRIGCKRSQMLEAVLSTLQRLTILSSCVVERQLFLEFCS